MLTIFNRKELLLTDDMKRQADVRDLLAQNGVDYAVKTINRQNPTVPDSSRARTGSFGIDLSRAYEYRIYVRKSDYEKAKSLIR